MRMFDANTTVLRDLQEESEVITEKPADGFKVVIARHPTLGRLVIITGRSGTGVVIETDE
jgi:hypothetical protein